MAKQTIEVDGKLISVNQINDQDYISLTDMATGFAPDRRPNSVIEGYMRNNNTLRYLEAWEMMYNENFKHREMAVFRLDSNNQRINISPKSFVERTGAIGILSKSGRYGGTYAHIDIAMEFATWLDPVFKLYVVKEFQRLKQAEAAKLNSGWNYSRFLSKVNYRIHTDAIRDHLIPRLKEQSQRFSEVAIYADEADLLNLSVFGLTAKEWREANPNDAKKGNIRDFADVMQLNVLANLESLNSVMIEAGANKEKRFQLLSKTAISQYERLAIQAGMKKLKE